MKRIVIVGGGFGGLAAARALAGRRKRFALTMIDRKSSSDFLPLLPEVVGGRLPSAAVSVGLEALTRGLDCAFVHDAVQRFEPDRRVVIGAGREYGYDALIIAAGSEPDYHGNRAAQAAALPLNTAQDAERLAGKLREGRFAACVIVGGGYTGVELATHLWRRFRAERAAKAIVLVEAAPTLLAALPAWMRRYTLAHLDRLGILHFENCRLADVAGGRVALSNGRVFEPALLIWSAGVRTPACVRAAPFARVAQERVRVDEFLRARADVFVAGDSAAVMAGGRPLRMSVQFAITQGACAAANVRRYFSGAPPRAYRPLDPGFILPMGHGRSCGAVGGIRLRGRLPTLMHYLMCAYRLPTLAKAGEKYKLAWQLYFSPD